MSVAGVLFKLVAQTTDVPPIAVIGGTGLTRTLIFVVPVGEPTETESTRSTTETDVEITFGQVGANHATVIEFVFCPEMIVPPVGTLHVYEFPITFGVLYVCVELPHGLTEPEIDGVGTGRTRTVSSFSVLQSEPGTVSRQRIVPVPALLH